MQSDSVTTNNFFHGLLLVSGFHHLPGLKVIFPHRPAQQKRQAEDILPGYRGYQSNISPLIYAPLLFYSLAGVCIMRVAPWCCHRSYKGNEEAGEVRWGMVGGTSEQQRFLCYSLQLQSESDSTHSHQQTFVFVCFSFKLDNCHLQWVKHFD